MRAGLGVVPAVRPVPTPGGLGLGFWNPEFDPSPRLPGPYRAWGGGLYYELRVSWEGGSLRAGKLDPSALLLLASGAGGAGALSHTRFVFPIW